MMNNNCSIVKLNPFLQEFIETRFNYCGVLHYYFLNQRIHNGKSLGVIKVDIIENAPKILKNNN